MRRRLALLCGLVLPLSWVAVSSSGGETDWPQMRGPARNGVGTSRGLARQWPVKGPFVVWKRPIGPGFSSIAVADGRVYTLAAEGESDWAYSFDAATGQELWKSPLGPRFTGEFGDGPRSTPTVVDGVVYAASGRGKLSALSAADGKAAWSVDLLATFGGEQPRFGFAPSPLVDGELVVIDAGGPGGKGLVALDRATGKTRWTFGEAPTGYSSPIAVNLGGVHQILTVRQKEPELVSLTPEGKVNWRSPAPPYVLSMPVFLPPDQVYLSTSEDVGGELLRIGSENGQPKVERVWENRLMRNHVHAAVPVGDYLYGFDNATLKAISMATGEQAWAHRGFGKGSVISADGLLFVLSDNGLLTLVEARPDAYQEKGQFQALTGRTWTALSVAGTRLFLRDQDELLCLEIGPGVDGLQEAETAANSPQ